MKNVLVAAAAVAALSACATSSGPTYLTINSTFDEQEVAWAKIPGGNTVKASALLRQVSGGVVTCAGYDMNLFPVGTYSTERMAKFYGNANKGYWTPPSSPFVQAPILPEPPASYTAIGQKKICDPQGFATFNNLADGEYYVTAQVTWQTPTGNQYFNTMATQGGMLMQRISVSGGTLHEIVLTN